MLMPDTDFTKSPLSRNAAPAAGIAAGAGVFLKLGDQMLVGTTCLRSPFTMPVTGAGEGVVVVSL